MNDKPGLMTPEEQLFFEWKDLIEKRLQELLPRENTEPSELTQAMRYAVLGGGKQLRPLLCMASCLACDGNAFSALDAGCALEFVHCFSLIHDDLPALDNDELRRGKPACHVKFGEAVAILSGDALFCLAFETLCKMNVSDSIKMRLIYSLAKNSGYSGMVGGEAVDILSENKKPEMRTVEFIHEKKTGLLMGASCEMGAIVADASEKQCKALYEFGVHIGTAFQIVDDILNETKDERQLGKPSKSDRQRQKATFPALVGLEASRVYANAKVSDALQLLESFGESANALRELALFIKQRES